MRLLVCFVAIDGPKGAGKSSVLDALRKRLPNAVFTREPTPDFDARLEHISGGDGLHRAVADDRDEHVTSLIAPSIASGQLVISDRYLMSTLVIQGLEGVGEAAILARHGSQMLPSLQVVLLASAPVIERRRALRGSTSRIERDYSANDELSAYRAAIATFERLAVDVIVVENREHDTIDYVASQIVDALAERDYVR